MHIPFLSKRNKKILKDNEQRIHSLTKDQQKAILKDPTIKPEKKLEALLLELNEMKVLFDELQLEFAKDLRSGGTYVISMSSNEFTIIPNVKVLKDNRIQLGKRDFIDIRAKDKVGKIKGRYGKITQFRAFFVEKEGEVTYDPIDATPIEIKIKNEKQLLLAHTTTEAEVGASLMKDIGKEKKKWTEYIPHMLITFSITAVLFFLSQYNLTKPV